MAGLRWRRARRAPAVTAAHVLVIVHNLSVPFDRRTWLQCRALRAAGYDVSVICPREPGQPGFERLEGIDVHRYRGREATGGLLGYAIEFLVGWVATARLAARIWRRQPFQLIQACNPPDTYFVLARAFAPLGVRFVFDQHDLSPELYAARGGRPRRSVRWALDLVERGSLRQADHVIVTNESFRRRALQRVPRPPASVTVVRNGPDLDSLVPVPPDPSLRHGRRYLCCYLGVMGAQDGIEVLLSAIHAVVFDHGVRDCHFALLGYGERKGAAEAWIGDHGLSPWVTFTGRVGDEVIRAYLSTADLGLAPEPPNAFNARCTIMKVMEYMAFGVPVVAFDLPETRVSAGAAGSYVDGGAAAYAARIAALLDDAEQRAEMGRVARERIERELAWRHQGGRYLEVIAAQLPAGEPRSAAATPATAVVPW